MSMNRISVKKELDLMGSLNETKCEIVCQMM